jgi:type I restriction enzyme S subunit
MQTISEVRDGFKETEIGLIPSDWDIKQLREILNLSNGRRPEFTERGVYPVFGANGIMGHSNNFLTDNDFTLIIGRVGASGQVHLASGRIWVSDNAIYSRTYDKIKIDLRFLYFLLKEIDLSRYATKTTHPLITQSFLNSFKIPLPDLPEQRNIAFVLSKIQQAIQQQDKIIEATKNLKKSLMQKLFTEGTRGEEQKETEIGLIPKSWDVTELGNVAIQRKELVLPRGHNDVPYIGLEHIDPWNVNITRFGGSAEVKSSKYKFYKNDILYGKLRPYLDKAALASFGGLCSTDIIVIKTSERITPLFLVNLLHLRRFVNYATSTMTGVNHPRTSWTALSKFKLPLPPLHEQQEIANTLSLIDRKIEIEEKREITLQQLFKTMLNKLMTGEIRVKDLDLGVINVS